MSRVEKQYAFNPIHMILENEKEYIGMRHLLSCPGNRSLKEYAEQRNKNTTSYLDLEFIEKLKIKFLRDLE